MRSILLFFASALFLSPAFACALNLPPSASPILITLDPRHPTPNSTVRVSVTSVTTDLSQADAEWRVNGAIAKEGEGRLSFEVPVEEFGSFTDVAVTIWRNEVLLGREELRIYPSSLDLIWAADSYTPPFYRGKRLASPGSSVTLRAITLLPDESGKAVPVRDIFYTWYRNGAVQERASGKGRASALFPAPLPGSTDVIEVEAAVDEGGARAIARADIPAAEPLIALYHDHSLFGVLFHDALGERATVPDLEATFAAFPYFSPDPRDRALSFVWRVNGKNVPPDPAEPGRLTINAENSNQEAQLALSLQHASNIFFSAQRLWSVNFGVPPAGTFGAPRAGSPFGI